MSRVSVPENPSTPLPEAIRDQALAWFTLAQSGEMNSAQALALQQWRNAHVQHEQAWQRFNSIRQQLQRRSSQLANPLARQTLKNTPAQERDRRQVLKILLGAGLLGGTAWQASDSFWLQSTLADYHTGTGERSHYTLADGTQIWLNTRTLLDVHYDAQVRRLTLRQGEIDVLTTIDPGGRPLLVYTAEARLQPLGTRFSVRREEDGRGTLLAVSSGKVAASLKNGGDSRVVQAHSQAWISSRQVYPAQPANLADTAWIDGFIVAERMRLGDFIQELSRHVPGLLRCDPAVADLRLTGSYPLQDPEQIFSMLEQRLPVTVQRRTRYWTTLTSR